MKTMTAIAMVTAMCMSMPAFAAMDKTNAEMQKKNDYFFSKVDMNNDGMISQDEHEAFSEKMFKDADTNKDGKLSKEESMAAHKRERMEMKNATDRSAMNQRTQ